MLLKEDKKIGSEGCVFIKLKGCQILDFFRSLKTRHVHSFFGKILLVYSMLTLELSLYSCIPLTFIQIRQRGTLILKYNHWTRLFFFNYSNICGCLCVYLSANIYVSGTTRPQMCGFFFFLWLGHKLGPISKRGPRGPWGPAGAGLGPGKKPGTLNGAGPGHGSCPAGRVRV